MFLVQSSAQDLVFRDWVSAQRPLPVLFPALPLNTFRISTKAAERRQMNTTKLIMVQVNVLHGDLGVVLAAPAQNKGAQVTHGVTPLHPEVVRGVYLGNGRQRSNIQTFVVRPSSSRGTEKEATPPPHRNTRQHLQELAWTP